MSRRLPMNEVIDVIGFDMTLLRSGHMVLDIEVLHAMNMSPV